MNQNPKGLASRRKSCKGLNDNSSFLMPHSSLSIYIHVPFCVRKCAYCDFASFPGREADWGRYFDEILTEIRLWSEISDFGLLSDRYRVKTMFIGGGTPTLVDAGYLEKMIDACRGIAPFEADAEITVEGNPGTLTPQKLADFIQEKERATLVECAMKAKTMQKTGATQTIVAACEEVAA